MSTGVSTGAETAVAVVACPDWTDALACAVAACSSPEREHAVARTMTAYANAAGAAL
jgi:hypothetical protein